MRAENWQITVGISTFIPSMAFSPRRWPCSRHHPGTEVTLVYPFAFFARLGATGGFILTQDRHEIAGFERFAERLTQRGDDRRSLGLVLDSEAAEVY